MADDADLAACETELHDAICQVLSRHNLMPTKWLLGVEGIDNDGERVLEGFASPDFRAWDSLGILAYLDARERGVVGGEAAAQILGDEGE